LNAAQEQAPQEGSTLFPVARAAMVGDLEARFAAAGAGGAEASDIMENFRTELARSRREDAAAGRALTGPHRSDLAVDYAAKERDARLCSTGEQKALLISLTLAAARAMTADRGAAPILLLDEVAAHLDADRRAGLYEALCGLGAQAWMTGTEAGLFAALGRRAQGFAVAEGPEGSTVTEAALA
jgi:DNA replication and repair protein RecF